MKRQESAVRDSHLRLMWRGLGNVTWWNCVPTRQIERVGLETLHYSRLACPRPTGRGERPKSYLSVQPVRVTCVSTGPTNLTSGGDRCTAPPNPHAGIFRDLPLSSLFLFIWRYNKVRYIDITTCLETPLLVSRSPIAICRNPYVEC